MSVKLPRKKQHLFRLRSILLLATLAILMLPLGSLYFFSLYENELVRQTESELIAQSAVLAASFKQLVEIQHQGSPYGIAISSKRMNQKSSYSSVSKSIPQKQASRYTPINASLDLSKDPILPRREAAKPSGTRSDLFAQQIGLQLKDILIDTQKVTLAGMRILDMHGTVIAGRSEMGLSLAHIPEVKQALRGKYKSVIRERISDEARPPIASISRGTGIRVFTAFPVVSNQRLYGIIYLSRTPKNLLKHLYENRNKVMTVATVILIVTLLLVLFVASTIARPIRKLIQQTQQVTLGKRDHITPLKNPVTNEVALLSESFANMANTLSDRSNYIREFASHVSHEFKTPITSMQGALELLQEYGSEMPAEKQQHFIKNMLEDTDRLKRLVTRLLELAKVDAMDAIKESCDILSCLSPLSKRFSERGLKLILPTNTAEVAIPHESLETIFSNLFDNSLQHGATQSSVDLEITGETVILIIKDNGEGISSSNKKRIFTPFFTTRREQGGTGLGLGIISSILQTYHGSIELLENNPKETGASFKITLSTGKNISSVKL